MTNKIIISTVGGLLLVQHRAQLRNAKRWRAQMEAAERA